MAAPELVRWPLPQALPSAAAEHIFRFSLRYSRPVDGSPLFRSACCPLSGHKPSPFRGGFWGSLLQRGLSGDRMLPWISPGSTVAFFFLAGTIYAQRLNHGPLCHGAGRSFSERPAPLAQALGRAADDFARCIWNDCGLRLIGGCFPRRRATTGRPYGEVFRWDQQQSALRRRRSIQAAQRVRPKPRT